MTSSRLTNKFLKTPNTFNEVTYKKHRNYCVNLLRREKRKYYENLDLNKITDNKTFWKQMKSFFTTKGSLKHITLIEGEDIISDDLKVTEILNNFIASSISNLNMRGYNTPPPDSTLDKICNIIYMFKSHQYSEN